MSRLFKPVKETPAALCSGLMLVASLTSSAALAQGDGRLPPPPLPSAVNGAPATLGAPASMPAPAAAPAAAAINLADLKVEAGAAEDKRRALLGRIMDAKNQGIGISTYMMAFDALEQSAKGGESEENVAKRVASLNSSLDDQFKRSAILKVQRAAPPVAASAAVAPLGGSMGTPPGNTDTAALIQKLQNKFGGQIPEGFKDKIPGGDPSALLKNPDIQDILKGLKK
ncbi:MAG: hypothetical protein JST01_14590 [Cyanobacteria bacterium SZAS TMP-1]|nr:hypothetical protein [Cyanobacteria bacterium SZAS TMP-1]